MQDKHGGAFAETWAAVLAASEVPTVDVSAEMGNLLASKEEDEVKNVRKAAYLVSSALNMRCGKRLEGREG